MKLLLKSIGLVMATFLFASGQATAQPTSGGNYEQPTLLTGTIYEASSGTNKVLFTFKRVATRSNSTVFVTRDFFYPNGTVAAQEKVVFENGKLLSFQLDEKQTGARGSATMSKDAKNPTRQQILFGWITTDGGKTKTKTDNEIVQSEPLIADMIPYFIKARWNELARGDEVDFRFIASSRLETVGFKMVKDSELSWRGKAAVRLKMEPSSVIIRQIVDPLFFIVEKDSTHRVFEYVGRTTPKTRDGTKWKDLDARSVYDW